MDAVVIFGTWSIWRRCGMTDMYTRDDVWVDLCFWVGRGRGGDGGERRAALVFAVDIVIKRRKGMLGVCMSV